MIDPLGDRIKAQYEDRTRYKLPRRTYTIIRIDGKAFHTLTRNCKRPFDYELMRVMNITAFELCKEVQCCKLAYVQSDEINLLLSDLDTITTDMWFDGNIQKICSVSASIATAVFNLYEENMPHLAHFDSRCFTIPDQVEVENYFIWRQKDATKNSIQMVARSLYSHKELDRKSLNELQEMIFQKGINWNDYSVGEKRGRCVVKEEDGWKLVEPPIFTEDRQFLNNIINNIRKD